MAQVTPYPEDRPKKSFVPSKYQNTHHAPGAIDTTFRNSWIKHTVDSLLNNLNSLTTKNITINQRVREEQPYLTCRIIDSGFITAGNDTCFIFLHSAHQNASIGDVILAISDKGNVYINDGHVCGGIVHLRSLFLEKPASFKEFIERFTPDLSTSAWWQYR